MSAGDYPTDDELRAIANAPTAREALDACRAAWNTAMGSAQCVETLTEALSALSYRDRGSLLCFATGGWSGNEECLRVLWRTTARWCWRLSAAGGLHVYEYPAEDAP